MYCSAVGTTLRAAPLAEEEVLTGQVVREVDDARDGRGALGGPLLLDGMLEARRV
jgi:hypothetical protein